MSEQTLRRASVALALVGAAIASYLLYVRWSGGNPVCSSGGCETVQRSAYAELVGLPVAALGLTAFLAILAAAVSRGEWARLAQATIALSAFLFSSYLLYVQLVVIDVVCQWCVASDVITTGITGLALLRLRLASLPARFAAG